MTLEAQLEDMHEATRRGSSSEDNSELLKKMNEQIQKCQSLDSDNQKKNIYIDDLEFRVASGTDNINRLQEQLNKKDDDMRAMEERYRRYLEKAKSVSV